jgi:hypothetical protein
MRGTLRVTFGRRLMRVKTLERSNLILLKTDFFGIKIFCLPAAEPSLSKTELLFLRDGLGRLSRMILGLHSF